VEEEVDRCIVEIGNAVRYTPDRFAATPHGGFVGVSNSRARSLRAWTRDAHSFLVIEENRLAFAAAMQLRTGEASRPCRLVTVTGPAGVGKSHLARQLVREALAIDPQLVDVHLTAAEFAAEFAAAAEARCIPEFQQSLRRPGCSSWKTCRHWKTVPSPSSSFWP
jgi:hypothetical protein